MPAVLNASNEVAVEAFLKGKIKFYRITEAVISILESMDRAASEHTLDGILDADREARAIARKYLGI